MAFVITTGDNLSDEQIAQNAKNYYDDQLKKYLKLKSLFDGLEGLSIEYHKLKTLGYVIGIKDIDAVIKEMEVS